MQDVDYQKFCKELVDLDEALVAAFVISHGIRGSYVKIDVPVLKEDDAKRLSEQTDTVMNIVRSNEHLFGGLGYLLVHHEAIDGMFFPVNGATTVLVGVIKPYKPEEIERAVSQKIGTSLLTRNDSI